MTMATASSMQHNSLKTTLLLSILLHLIIVKYFYFTFPVRPAARKPHFIFFGSILESRDFIDLAAAPKGSQTLHKENLTVAYSSTYFNPIKITSVKKPDHALSGNNGEKTFSKMTFLEENDNKSSKATLGDMPPYLPPIVPLHLKIRRW